jgi:hypothetical protein
MCVIIRTLRAKSAAFSGKNKKNNSGNISSRKSPTLLQQAPKKFKNILHRRRKRVFREKEKTVKKTLVRVLVVFALMALGSTTVLADGGNLPPCPPKIQCSVSR